MTTETFLLHFLTGLQGVQRFPLCGRNLRELFDLLGQSTDQVLDHRLALLKGRLDVVIGRGAKVHRMDHNLYGPCCTTIAGPE